MNYSFDVEMAKKLGVNEAIMLQNIVFWLKKNKANRKNFFDGRYWTYNSYKAFVELFPFWSEPQIKRIIQSLAEQGVIVKGNYNESPYDRTNWYSLTDEYAFLIGGNDLSDETKSSAQKNEVVPSILTDRKPDRKPDRKTDEDILSGRASTVSEIQEIVEYLNKKSGTSYRHTTPKTVSLLKARIREGFKLEDFKTVIDKKVALWGKDPKMQAYLRPETLFGTKFESYLNEKVSLGKLAHASGAFSEKVSKHFDALQAWANSDDAI